MSTHQKYTVPQSPESSTGNLDVTVKFRIYRMDAESTERKLKDAKEVIERLKEETNSSRDSEKNLRSQLISAQNRLISLQHALKKIINLSERQRQNEKISQQIEQKLEKISKAIEHTRNESKNLLKQISSEMDLEKEIANLRSILAAKARQHDLMKMEVQTLTAEKKNMENANQQKLKNLESELEKLKQRETEAKTSYSEMLTYYQQQLEERDQAIKLYEKERKSFLEDFEPTKTSEMRHDKCGGSAISNLSPKRLPKADRFDGHKSQTKSEDFKANNTLSQQSEERTKTMKCRKGGDQSFTKASKKQKPQLEFLAASQPSSQSTNSIKGGRKRRLFLAESNYCMD